MSRQEERYYKVYPKIFLLKQVLELVHHDFLEKLTELQVPLHQEVLSLARAAAQTLDLEFEHVPTGFGELETKLVQFAQMCRA